MIHFQGQTNKGVPMEESISFKHIIQAENYTNWLNKFNHFLNLERSSKAP
jgi:hypothetical protein